MRRLGATLVNPILFVFSILVVLLLTIGLSPLIAYFDLDRKTVFITSDVLMLVITLFIQLIFMYVYRQTVGKKLMKIRVVNYYSKQQVSFIRYVFREIFEVIGVQLIFIYLINIVMIFVNKEKRTLTDFLFSTIVVKDK
ncbi:putative RDD family membrane protein YckC [Bisgaardia hudsonensis]|uniref:Putative RDD family membrane protein YckC n=1 Tax=Bisgaardia hudsonensis TaxID=109472 RepID=A0A4R2N0U6_9PAST|nr:RDD family protein [Bisgaardia hudsonensis]QLB13246.1 hypothetical protein A6A11_06280 [Bisgaardia hudsonensis]TCP13172.1 putative RDD family membrane protein YckC [Bisgaardia hudsonensis]